MSSAGRKILLVVGPGFGLVVGCAHRKAAAAMRQAYQGRTAAARVPAADDVQQRDLADYDEIFGLDDGREVA